MNNDPKKKNKERKNIKKSAIDKWSGKLISLYQVKNTNHNREKWRLWEKLHVVL